MPSSIIHNWIYISQWTKISRNDPYKFFKVKSVTKYTLFKKISVNIIFYYNKPHISLTYNLILNNFDIQYIQRNCTMVTCIITKILRILYMSKQAAKGRLSWCNSELIRFKNWYHEKVKRKNKKLKSQLNSKVGLKTLNIISQFYELVVCCI